LKRVGSTRVENMCQEMVYGNRMHLKAKLSQSLLSKIVCRWSNTITLQFYLIQLVDIIKLCTHLSPADGAKRRARVLIPRLFTPVETKPLEKSKVHQLSRAWVTNGVRVLDVWSSSLISKIWRTVMNSGHWLVQFNVFIITTAWRQRNSKHCFISWFDDW
jgi:hypothetical protein